MKTEWKKVRLGEIATFSNGINFGKESYSAGVKLISVSDFGDRYFPDYDSLVEIDEKVLRESDYLKDGDIVFVRSNGNKELVGRCMMIKNPQYPVTYSGFCIRARLNDLEKFDTKFFLYNFKSRKFRQSIANLSKGTNIQNLNQQILSNYEIDLPPLSTQQKIAGVLSAYDDLIENNRRQIKLLEEAAQKLYKEWFVKLNFPGHENAKIVDGVPDGWKYKSLNSLVDFQNGYAFKSDSFDETGEYRLITIKNVKDGAFDYLNVNKIKVIPSGMQDWCKLEIGDSLVSLTGNVGRVCLVTAENCLLNQRVAKIACTFPSYAYVLFRSKDMFNIMNKLAKGAAQQNLSPIQLGEEKILMPENQLIKRFDQLVEPFVKEMVQSLFLCD